METLKENSNSSNYKFHKKQIINSLKSDVNSRILTLSSYIVNTLIFASLSYENWERGSIYLSSLWAFCFLVLLYVCFKVYKWKNVLKYKLLDMEQDNANYLKNEKEKKENLDKLKYFS